MPDQIDTDAVSKAARSAAEEVAADLKEVHEPLWKAREDLAKLAVSLSSAIIVGTITFSGGLIGSAVPTATYPVLVVVSWSLLFISLVAGVVSLWYSTKFRSFRVLLTNAEPQLLQQASKLDASLPPAELQQQLLALVATYARAGSKPLGRADSGALAALATSLISFGLGVGTFLCFGALQVI